MEHCLAAYLALTTADQMVDCLDNWLAASKAVSLGAKLVLLWAALDSQLDHCLAVKKVERKVEE